MLQVASVLTNTKPTRSIREGEDVETCRGPQAVACEERHVENLGGPVGSWTMAAVHVWHAAIEAQKGKPGHGAMPKPGRGLGWGAAGRVAEPQGEANEGRRGVGPAHSTASVGKPRTWGRGWR